MPLAPDRSRALRAMRRAVTKDRLWFERHPHARVRFRRVFPGEFTALQTAGKQVPNYLPPGVDPATPCIWVAVVDLSRLLGSSPGDGVLRARIRTVPIRSRRLQQAAAELLQEDVLAEVLQLQAQVAHAC